MGRDHDVKQLNLIQKTLRSVGGSFSIIVAVGQRSLSSFLPYSFNFQILMNVATVTASSSVPMWPAHTPAPAIRVST